MRAAPRPGGSRVSSREDAAPPPLLSSREDSGAGTARPVDGFTR